MKKTILLLLALASSVFAQTQENFTATQADFRGVFQLITATAQGDLDGDLDVDYLIGGFFTGESNFGAVAGGAPSVYTVGAFDTIVGNITSNPAYEGRMVFWDANGYRWECDLNVLAVGAGENLRFRAMNINGHTSVPAIGRGAITLEYPCGDEFLNLWVPEESTGVSAKLQATMSSHQTKVLADRISAVGMKTWPDDAARASATYAPDFIGQLGSQIDKPNIIFRAVSVAADGWVHVAGATSAVIHITQDASRPNMEGSGTTTFPYNALGIDALKDILEDNSLVPDKSKVVIGPGTYLLTGTSGYLGISLTKNIAIKGAGAGKTIIKFEDGTTNPTNGQHRAWRLFAFDLVSQYVSNVEISDMTLDANFDDWSEVSHPGFPAAISQGALYSYAKRTIMRDIDVINCGEHENQTEAFYILVGNFNASEAWAEFTRVKFYNEVAKVGVYDTGFDAAPFLIGSGTTGAKYCSGKFVDCEIRRANDGVGYGIATVGDVELINCSHYLDSADADCIPILQDTSVERSRSITVTGGYYEYGKLAVAAVLTANCQTAAIRGATFKTTHTQGGGQHMFLLSNGLRILDGVIGLGSADPGYESSIAWPALVPPLFGTQGDPPVLKTFVSNCVMADDLKMTNVGRHVALAYNNKTASGALIGGNAEGNTVETGITLTAPVWVVKSPRTFDSNWDVGFHGIGSLIVNGSLSYINIYAENGQAWLEPGVGENWTRFYKPNPWADIPNAKQLTANYNVIDSADLYSVAVLPPAQKDVKVTVVHNGVNSIYLAPYQLDDLGEGVNKAMELKPGMTIEFSGKGGIVPINYEFAGTANAGTISEGWRISYLDEAYTNKVGQGHYSTGQSYASETFVAAAIDFSDVGTKPNSITIAAHGFLAGQIVRLSTTGTFTGSGIVADTDYTVRLLGLDDANVFQLSSDAGATAVDILSAPAGTHTIALSDVDTIANPDRPDQNATRWELIADTNIFWDRTTTGSGTALITATTDGLTSGVIDSWVRRFTVTSSNAAHISTLPAATADMVGVVMTGYIGVTGFELRTPASSNATINGVDSDGTNEAAIPDTTSIELRCVAVDTWILVATDELGAPLTIVIDP